MKYSTKQINTMRKLLAKRDVEQSDESTLFDVFTEGCTGWANFDDKFVIEHFEDYFGEDYFEVIVDNNKQ
jgi:hypothetical protein